MLQLIRNRKKKLFFWLFLLILIFFLCLIVKFFCKKEKLDNFVFYKKEKISDLTLEQKIGQLFIIGLEGKTVTPEI